MASRALLFMICLLLALQVRAQRKDGQYWPCNPMKNKTCDPNPGLNRWSYFIDFTNPPDSLEDEWSTSNYATIGYGKNGAEFTYAKRFDAPQLFTNFYIHYGRVDVEMQVAPGIGMISSSVLMSDSFDEIDWEMSGNNFNLAQQYPKGVVQNNYFSKGIVGNYGRGMWVPLESPQKKFYTYSVDWTPTRLQWLIDGAVVRTFLAKDADTTTHQYPQTPSKIQLGIWNGGDPSMNDGTRRWAGGDTDFSKMPFTMYVKNVRITNYNPARYYNWTNQSGSSGSIKALNISLPEPTKETPTTSTTATSMEPLRTDLPLSPNGHCGTKAGTICKGSLFGDCCSFYNYCGNTTEYCGLGCQSAFGLCGQLSPIQTTGVTSAPGTIAPPASSIKTEPSTAPTSTPTSPATSKSSAPTSPTTDKTSASSTSKSDPTSVLTNPTTIIISLSRTTTASTSGETQPSKDTAGPTTPSSAASLTPTPSQSPTGAGTTKTTEANAPTSQTTPVSVAYPTTSPKITSPGTTATDPSPTSKIPVPPIIEKPVVSTDKPAPTYAASTPSSAASSITKPASTSVSSSSSSGTSSTTKPIPTSVLSPTPSPSPTPAPTTPLQSGPLPTTSKSNPPTCPSIPPYKASLRPTIIPSIFSSGTTVIPTTAPTTAKPTAAPAPTTTTTPTSAKTTAQSSPPTAAPTTNKPTSPSPTASPAKTTAAGGGGLMYVATTMPVRAVATTGATTAPAEKLPRTTVAPTPTTAAPVLTPVATPDPRRLCFWWGRWYCWNYKRAYPLETGGYRAS